MTRRPKLIWVSTVPISLKTFCNGLFRELSDQYEVMAISSPGADLDLVASREHIRTESVPMERAISPIRDLKALSSLIRIFRRERPDIVHSITPKAGLLTMMASAIARVPVRIHTCTGLLFPTATGLRRQLFKLTDRITCLCATDIIPEGEGVKNDLLTGGITRKQMHILGYGNLRGIDTTHYSRTPQILRQAAAIRQNLGIAENDFVFIFIGRLVADKGIRELVHAFKAVHRQGIHLILVGDPDERDRIDESTLREMSTLPGIHRAGFQEDVRPWYAAADALVFPSYREGFPNVVIEAGAMGLPSIVTDINGSREIITEGFNGTIVPPRDTEALTKAMEHFLTHRSSLADMGTNARDNVTRKYQQHFVRKCLKEHYRDILTK